MSTDIDSQRTNILAVGILFAVFGVDKSQRITTGTAAFANDAPFGGQQKLCHFRTGADGVFGLEFFQNGFPSQAAAKNQTVNFLERLDLLGCSAISPKTDLVETDDAACQTIDGDKRRHILHDVRLGTDHGQGTDTAKLVNAGSAPQNGPVAEFDMACEHHVIHEDVEISHGAIVGHVRVDHEKVFIAYRCSIAFFHSPMNGRVFSKCIPVADQHLTTATGGRRMLRHSTDDRPAAKVISLAEGRSLFNCDMGFQSTAIADANIVFNDAKWADFNVYAEFNFSTDNSLWMNIHGVIGEKNRRK